MGMKETRTITVEINSNYEGCDKCKYEELSKACCQAMKCIHSFTTLKECYKPKESENTHD